MSMGENPGTPQGARAGRRHADIAARVILGTFAVATLVGVVTLVILPAGRKGRLAHCMHNLHAIDRAHRMYVADQGAYVADVERWPGVLMPYFEASSPGLLVCFSDSRDTPHTWQGRPVSYTMNMAVAGANPEQISAPEALPLWFDGTTMAGGVDVVAFRHRGAAVCLFASGNARGVRPGDWRAESMTPDIQIE